MPIDPQADSARGALVGATAGLLTVAAHGVAGGGYPSVASLTLLVAFCTVVGSLAATVSARGAVPTVALLGAGQLAGHYLLAGLLVSDGWHAHAASWPMLVAHIGATALCAVAILAAERLYTAITRITRIVAIAFVRPDTAIAVVSPIHRTTRPLFGVPLRGTISRRGPPLAAHHLAQHVS